MLCHLIARPFAHALLRRRLVVRRYHGVPCESDVGLGSPARLHQPLSHKAFRQALLDLEVDIDAIRWAYRITCPKSTA